MTSSTSTGDGARRWWPWRAASGIILVTGMMVGVLGCAAGAETVPGTSKKNEAGTMTSTQHDTAEQHFTAYFMAMHRVIMSIHPGEWSVTQARYGALPLPCRIDGDVSGYSFDWRRSLTVDGLDHDATAQAATSAMRAEGWEPQRREWGSGTGARTTIVAEVADLGRAVITLRADDDRISASFSSVCHPGDAASLADEVFGGELVQGAQLRVPAVEGPDSTPQFSFPADSPLWFDEDGTPLATPTAPASGG